MRRPRWLGVASADTCSYAATAGGLEVELPAAALAQAFAEAPGREATASTPAKLAAVFTKRRRRKRKNVVVTAWDSTGDVESAAPVYFVGALAGAEASEGAGASMRLRLEQSAAQVQASRA